MQRNWWMKTELAGTVDLGGPRRDAASRSMHKIKL